MTHRNRLLAGALALALLAGACGGDDDDAASPGGDTDETPAAVDPERCPVDELEQVDEPVTITMWHTMTSVNAEELEAMVADYHASQDRVRVELVFTGSYDETFERYRTSARGQSAPDLVQLEETTLQQVIDSETAVPAAACIEAAGYDTSDHLPAVLAEFTVEDVLWPMPFNISTPILYFSQRRFEAAGLDPANPPTDLDGLLEASRAIVATGTSPQAFSLETQAWYVEQWFNMAGEPIVDQRNGRDGRATEALLEGETGQQVFDWLSTMLGEQLVLDVGRNPSGSDHFFAIAGNQASMTIGTSAALGGVYDALATNPGLEEEVGLGVAPLPGPTGGGVVPGGAALWLVDRGEPLRVAAAWDWSAWLNEPEQQARWHGATGYIPIRTSAIELPAVQQLWAERPGFEIAYRQVAESANEVGGPVIGGYPGFRDAVEDGIERLVQQGADIAALLPDIDTAATEAIQDYNELVGG
ncbi:MAG TPA: ABC transporter substrate-binding protein [Acidimicrobiales bacterium]|nr:ABC transporter substrate-binding protein [Acidimicrobiales bacterium]